MKKITQTDFLSKPFFLPLIPLIFSIFTTTAQTVSCVGSVTVALGDDCRKEILPQLLLKGTNLGSMADYQIALSFGPYAYTDNFVTARDIYRSITVKVSHKTTGNSCLSTVYTRDTIPPLFENPKDTTVHCSQTNATGTPLVQYAGEPKIISDCSGGVKYTYTDDTYYATCFTPFIQTPTGFPSDLNFNLTKAIGCSRVIVRNFAVRDTFDNKGTSRQVIYMKEALYSDVITTSVVLKYCNGTPPNTSPDTVVIKGIKIAGTGRPYYKTGLPLTGGYCHIETTWQDADVPSTDYTTIKRVWAFTNPCQNRTDTAVQLIYIYDGIPSITCKIAPIFQMNDTKTLDIKVQDVATDFSDQCTPKEKLVLGIKKVGVGAGFPLDTFLRFGCGDTLSFPVELWVKDGMGRLSSCNTTIRIIDTLYYCSPRPLSIGGKLNKENTNAVKAQVILSDVKNGILMEQPLATDFKFAVTKRDAAYKVIPTRPKDWLNGVTTYDIALISRHILDIDPIGSPYKIIAADVNGDGEISAADMLYLRRLVLHQIDSVPRSQPWRFVPSAFVFQNLDVALSGNYPQFLLYDHPADNVKDADFLAIKTGDVNLSARDNSLLEAQVRSALPSINFTVKKDETGNLVVSSDETAIQGFQMTLNFDKTLSNILGIETIGLQGFNDNNYAIFSEKKKITLSWNGKMQQGDLFKIKLKTPMLKPIQDIVQISSDLTLAEAYIEKDSVRTIKMVSKPENTEGGTLQLLPSMPNPFSDETSIRFNLPDNDMVELSIFDNQGRVLKTMKKTFQKGYNEMKISLYNTQTSVSEGILMYKIKTSQQIVVGRLAFIK
jgi:Dockerin type I domain